MRCTCAVGTRALVWFICNLWRIKMFSCKCWHCFSFLCVTSYHLKFWKCLRNVSVSPISLVLSIVHLRQTVALCCGSRNQPVIPRSCSALENSLDALPVYVELRYITPSIAKHSIRAHHWGIVLVLGELTLQQLEHWRASLFIADIVQECCSWKAFSLGRRFPCMVPHRQLKISINSAYIRQGLEYGMCSSALKALEWQKTTAPGMVEALRGASTALLVHIYMLLYT